MSTMILKCLHDVRVATSSVSNEVKKSDGGTLGIVFVAILCAVLPLDISQLTFAIIGAAFYALLQKHDGSLLRKKPVPVARNVAPRSAHVRIPRPKSKITWANQVPPALRSSDRQPVALAQSKPVVPLGRAHPTPTPDIFKASVQPVSAPIFNSKEWDGEVQELLRRITPTKETDDVVTKIAKMMRETIKATIPQIEVAGFASGNLTCGEAPGLTHGRAFGVAIPDVEMVATVSPHILSRHRSRNAQAGSASEASDPRKLQKSTLRSLTDQLVAAGFKFRRSAFKGQEPKVTLLVPTSLGIFAESIPVDFSVNVVTPLYNAALLTESGKIDIRAKELILLVKRWAKDRAICHTPKGHLSPYMWGILSIFFLQVRDLAEGPLLPPLEYFDVSSGLLTDTCTTAVRKDTGISLKSKWKSVKMQVTEPKQSTATLFKGFVQFFHKEFDWCTEAVSIRLGQRVPASTLQLPLHAIMSDESGAAQVGPSIEDPFQVTNNLGDCMNAISLPRLKEEFTRAQQLCMRGASLSELLEPWAPAAEANEQRNHDD